MGATVTPAPGSIGLVRIHGAAGRLIRFGQWLNGDGFADFEHAFTYVGEGRIVEAEPSGARLMPLGEYDGVQVVWLACPPQYAEGVADAARAMVGTPYGFADYLALALHHFHLPVPGLPAYVRSTKSLICSQLCVKAARVGGWDVLGREFDGYVTPGALRRLAAKQGGAA